MNHNRFVKHILTWFDQHGRKNLPWQQDKTPYRVWVSEIMLQQTQVNTVIPYFERFMQHFPNVATLANATEDEVLHYWTGLGYYSRARNLHRAAQLISAQKKFPDTLETLQELPGIGRSTAGAILAIAFKKPATILDGNVKRVLTRVFALTSDAKKISDELWEIATKLTPQKRVDDYTQAIMDLGATLCVRGKPLCAQCPLKSMCQALKLGIEKTLPQTTRKKNLPIRQATFFVFKHESAVLLEKRASDGIWGGLWSFPEVPQFLSLEEIRQWCKKHFRASIKQIALGASFRHTFSHFHLDILTAVITLTKPIDPAQKIWYNLQESPKVGLPQPVKKILRSL